MKNKVKILLSVISIICFIGLIIGLLFSIKSIVYFYGIIEISVPVIVYTEINNLYLLLITSILSFLLILTFNLFMWLTPLFGVPLTPSQLAERKRIRQERKKAKLQEKLNKIK